MSMAVNELRARTRHQGCSKYLAWRSHGAQQAEGVKHLQWTEKRSSSVKRMAWLEEDTQTQPQDSQDAYS